jgi:xanthine dehydrogenase YagR molybdenum-binding subunit
MPSSVGQPLTRADGRLKVTGRATYTADQQIPGLVHAVLLTSTIAKGRITSIDTNRAERVPGVLAVLTHKSGLKLAKDPSEISPDSPADRVLQLLQDDRILYGNQPIAIAVAETLEGAQEGAGLIAVEYDEKKPSVRLDQSMSTVYTPKIAGGAKEPAESRRGNIDQGLAQASTRLEQIYTTPFHTHSPMEPHATIALWEGTDKLTIYDASQGIFGDRKRVGDLLGLKPENVRVVSLFVGGGFGSKGPTWSHTMLCAMAARHLAAPANVRPCGVPFGNQSNDFRGI